MYELIFIKNLRSGVLVSFVPAVLNLSWCVTCVIYMACDMDSIRTQRKYVIVLTWAIQFFLQQNAEFNGKLTMGIKCGTLATENTVL